MARRLQCALVMRTNAVKKLSFAKLLDIPDSVTQTALLPVAYYKGKDFQKARRLPSRELTSWDSWGSR